MPSDLGAMINLLMDGWSEVKVVDFFSRLLGTAAIEDQQVVQKGDRVTYMTVD